jgi:hypothetical protein
VLHDQSKAWKDIAEGYMKDIWNVVREFLDDVLLGLFERGGIVLLGELIQPNLKPRIGKAEGGLAYQPETFGTARSPLISPTRGA